ncbi:MAG: deoxyribose-phosphate aldolase [Thermoleophilia bacterium]|nr:deoxyribose-phosphate aldolase [Thermoleophilia bacterium]
MHAEELAKTIDHTLLRADATAHDVERLCREAARYHFAAVCVFPHYVPLADGLLKSADVKVCTVISFPFGADDVRAKVAAAQDAIGKGADELDVVFNLPAMLSGEFGYVRDELAAVVRAARLKSVNSGRGHALVKAIIETCYLSNKMKRLACTILGQAGVDFAKTSTGLGPQGAIVQDVELLRDCLDEHIGVKASGGIRTLTDVELMINAGATRIGTSAGVAIMQEALGQREERSSSALPS